VSPRISSSAVLIRAYTHVHDVAGLVLAILDAPDEADRIFYGVAGGPLVTTTEVAQLVRELIPGTDVQIGEELSEGEAAVVALRGELSIENARSHWAGSPATRPFARASPSTSSTTVPSIQQRLEYRR
jgi:UDP-glucose 4-epimerase